jgi:hypothetical protein
MELGNRMNTVRWLVPSALSMAMLAGHCIAAVDNIYDDEFRREILELYKQDRHNEIARRYLAVLKATSDPTQQAGALDILVEQYWEKTEDIDPRILEEALAYAGSLRASASEELGYVIDVAPVKVAWANGDYAKAAEAAAKVREYWEGRTQRVLKVYELEPRLLYLSGQKAKALEVAAETWVEHPNDFRRNLAARVGLADSMNDHGESTEAYELLHELRLNYPREFRRHPYVVQNYLDYVGNAFARSSDDEEFLEEMVDAAQYGVDLVQDERYDSVRGAVCFSIAKLFHKLRDTDSARTYYELAQEYVRGDSEFVNNIRRWSQRRIERLKEGDYSDLDEYENGPERAQLIQEAKEMANWVTMRALEDDLGDVVSPENDVSGKEAANENAAAGMAEEGGEGNSTRRPKALKGGEGSWGRIRSLGYPALCGACLALAVVIGRVWLAPRRKRGELP